MANLLLEAPTNSSPEIAIRLSQRAPSFVTSQSSWLSSLPYPLSLFINTESQEKWQAYENLCLACLRTGDDTTAYACLESLKDRFGDSNDRILGLQGLYKEATAKNDSDLASVLGEYEEILKGDPTIFTIRKRRAALLRSLGRTQEAATALTNLLDQSPIDAEAWAELADLYLTQGSYEQAVFCLEEVLVVTPNSWNMHARLGEVLYLSAGKLEGAEQLRMLSESMRRFCRSIELCDDCLRGYYGLKLVRHPPTKRIIIDSAHILTILPDNHPPPRNPINHKEIPTDQRGPAKRRPSSSLHRDNPETERSSHSKTRRNSSKKCFRRERMGWIQSGRAYPRTRASR